ncbi:MAG: hypothetical protein AB9834_02035 [Lentimicrobium sp.]
MSIFVILIFMTGSAIAQKHQAGVIFGYGSTNTTNEFRPFLIPLNNPSGSTESLDRYYHTGICYYYTPAKYRFSIKTGLYYDYWDGRGELNAGFLNIPLGIDFSMGSKFRFIIGLGIYSGILIANTENLDINNPSLGFEVNVGIEYPVSPKLSLCAGYQHNIGIANFYTENRKSPGGTPYTIKYRRTDAMINVSVKYTVL